MTSMSELAISNIFGLFDKWGHENYIGEHVTQLQHSQQVECQDQYVFHILSTFHLTRLPCKLKRLAMMTELS